MNELLGAPAVHALLRRHGLRPSRALGQHFLADPNTARRIVRLAAIDPATPVVEVGPGLGSLTLALCDAGHRVRALELDRHLLPVLADVLQACAADVVHGDARTVDWPTLLDGAPRWAMVANLPYNVATTVVLRALETAPMIERFLVMVQREVGQRLAAAPGSKAYGAVSVKVAYYCESKLVGAVAPAVFVPRPNVDSALVLLTRRGEAPVRVHDTDRFFAIVRAGFATRRKSLRQALRAVFGGRTDSILAAAHVEPMARAETLDLDAWAELARAELELS